MRSVHGAFGSFLFSILAVLGLQRAKQVVEIAGRYFTAARNAGLVCLSMAIEATDAFARLLARPRESFFGTRRFEIEEDLIFLQISLPRTCGREDSSRLR